MNERKQEHFKSPDVTKMVAVVIDRNTTIFIPPDQDPEEARQRFTARVGYRRP